jgi:hypothetical protein
VRIHRPIAARPEKSRTTADGKAARATADLARMATDLQMLVGSFRY